MFRVDYVGNAPYLSCTSSVRHHRLSSSDRFLVLSSDGLYQYFNNEEVVAHVTWFMENVPEGDPAQYLIAELLFRAAKKNGQFHLPSPYDSIMAFDDNVRWKIFTKGKKVKKYMFKWSEYELLTFYPFPCKFSTWLLFNFLNKPFKPKHHRVPLFLRR